MEATKLYSTLFDNSAVRSAKKHMLIKREFNLQVDSLKGIQTRLPELVAQTMADPDQFRDLYRFTFKARIIHC